MVLGWSDHYTVDMPPHITDNGAIISDNLDPGKKSWSLDDNWAHNIIFLQDFNDAF